MIEGRKYRIKDTKEEGIQGRKLREGGITDDEKERKGSKQETERSDSRK